jgi:hypothetical protein
MSFDESANDQSFAMQNFQITLLILPISVSKSKGVSSDLSVRQQLRFLAAMSSPQRLHIFYEEVFMIC